MTTIALDAMGGDHGPDAAVEGAAHLSTRSSPPQMILVGDKDRIEGILDRVEHERAHLTIVHTDSDVGGLEVREVLAGQARGRPQTSPWKVAELKLLAR